MQQCSHADAAASAYCCPCLWPLQFKIQTGLEHLIEQVARKAVTRVAQGRGGGGLAAESGALIGNQNSQADSQAAHSKGKTKGAANGTANGAAAANGNADGSSGSSDSSADNMENGAAGSTQQASREAQM